MGDRASAREVLERELYWADGRETGPVRTAAELRSALQHVERRVRADMARGGPPKDWEADRGPRWKRALKGFLYRLLRPLSRRYDRLTAELASLGSALADQLTWREIEIRRLQAAVDAIGRRLGVPVAEEEAAEYPAAEAFYERYEAKMRGSSESIVARLGRYGEEIIALRERAADERPLWIDLGCGRGEFLGLLEEWGWRVQGVDASARAIDECRAQGMSATKAELFDFLEHYAGEAPLGMSAIQLIEHLPKERWLAFFEDTHRMLAPGGVLLVETINPLEATALTSAFFADITHTWPAHPETLRLMALHAGYARAEVVFLESDENGAALDFAVWAWVD